MTVRKLDKGKWICECYPAGRSERRVRKQFAILAIQKILGHHDVKMTMRYAHLGPEHLKTALRFNLLATTHVSEN